MNKIILKILLAPINLVMYAVLRISDKIENMEIAEEKLNQKGGEKCFGKRK